ncbi:MAG: hypothetical protein IOD12_02220 [Silvanigrellales bacterium]|nr:hypothetical protein [Silvanigrellales bacterium]
MNSRFFNHGPFFVTATLLALGSGCAKSSESTETEFLRSNQSTTVTPQRISCTAPASGDFKLVNGAFTYTSPVRDLNALKAAFASTTINVFDQWVKSESPVRIDLRNLNVVTGSNRLEGRGLGSNTESLFDVVVETKSAKAGSQSLVYIEKIRVYHKNMRSTLEVTCPAPTLPSAGVVEGLNALAAGVFKAQCPNAKDRILFRFDMNNYGSGVTGTLQSQLQYNQGATWIPTDGSRVSSDGSVINMGNLYSFNSWMGGQTVELPFEVQFPGDFRLSYQVKDNLGGVLREFASEPVRVQRGANCALSSADVFHSVAAPATTAGASTSTTQPRGTLCTDARPTGYQGTVSLTYWERRECEMSNPNNVTAQIEKFGSDEGKRNRCMVAYFDRHCR